jgi:hypothetical protein
MPQFPHACVSGVSVVVGTQPLAPEQLPQLPHEPHEQPGSQVLERPWLPEPQLPHGSCPMSVVPGAQPPLDMHAPQVPQSLQEQVSLQVRIRDFSSPQEPQPVFSLSVAARSHTPSSVQTSVSHSQVGRHVRRSVPHLPHAPRSSMVPTLHAPSPSQPPSSIHSPEPLQS